MRVASWMFAVFAFGSFAAAQTNVQMPSSGNRPAQAPAMLPDGVTDLTRVTFAVTSNILNMRPVEGLPFTATGTIVVEQTLTDGSTVKNSYEVASWRDAQGRSRVEYEIKLPNLGSRSRMVMVRDPINGTSLIWADGNPQLPVRLMHIPALGQQNGRSNVVIGALVTNGAPPAVALPDTSIPNSARSATRPAIAPIPHNMAAPNPTHAEDLPVDTIAGLYVTGVRITRTIPAGTAGNERDIVVASETWTSPDLKITVRQITDDPRSGKVTTELTNVDRTDPDPALFQPPEGYTVRDMSLPAPAPPPTPH